MNSVHGNSKYSDPKIVSYKKLYNQYKSHSKLDKREFSLSLDDSIKIFSSNCHYCNSEPSRKFNVYKTSEKYITKNHIRADLAEILVNGIDRINSNIGYINSNVVPCCSNCNYAKHKMSYDDFFIWLNDVANENLYFGGILKHSGKHSGDILDTKNIPENIIKQRINSYVRSAKFRKIKFELSKIEFLNLIEKKCRYCGSFSRKSNYKYKINGIDRVDSSLNYTIDNCVSCCIECNLAKLNMSEENFFKWIDKILRHQGYKK
jgi:hypothetical protein